MRRSDPGDAVCVASLFIGALIVFISLFQLIAGGSCSKVVALIGAVMVYGAFLYANVAEEEI